MQRLGKSHLRGQTRVGAHILGQTIGNAIAYQISQGSNTADQAQKEPGAGADNQGLTAQQWRDMPDNNTPSSVPITPLQINAPPIAIKPFDLSGLDVTINLSGGGGSGSGGTTGIVSAVSSWSQAVDTRSAMSLLDAVNANNGFIAAVRLHGGSLPDNYWSVLATNANAAAYYNASPSVISQMQSGTYVSSANAYGVDVVPPTDAALQFGGTLGGAIIGPNPDDLLRSNGVSIQGSININWSVQNWSDVGIVVAGQEASGMGRGAFGGLGVGLQASWSNSTPNFLWSTSSSAYREADAGYDIVSTSLSGNLNTNGGFDAISGGKGQLGPAVGVSEFSGNVNQFSITITGKTIWNALHGSLISH